MTQQTISRNTSATELAELLIELGGVLRRHTFCDLLRVMRREELSMPQVATLWHLHHEQVASISDIRDHLNLSLAATSHLVDRLVVGGLVARTEDAHDRRQKQVTLTDAGRTLVSEIAQARNAELAHHLAALPPELAERALSSIAQLLEYFVDEPARSADTADRPEHALHTARRGEV